MSGAHPGVNLVNGRGAVAHNAVRRVATKHGAGLTWDSTANIGVQVGPGSLLPGSAGNYTSGMTLILLANPAASTTRTLPFSLSSGAQPTVYMGFNANKALTATSGMLTVQTHNNNGAQAASVIDGNWHVFAVVFPEGSALPLLYVDGVDVTASSSESASTYANAAANVYVGGFSSSGYSATGYAIPLALGFNRGIPAGEMADISRNLWQLFEADNEPIFYSLGGGATDYPVTATDALTLADSAAQGFGATGVATDAATLADSAAAAMAATSAASDALTLADSASNVAALSAVASDALTLADTLNASTAGNYTATGTDALTLADAASNVAALSAAASDALTLADSASNVAALSATAGDALTLADTLNASATGDYVVASSDAMTLADSAAAAFAAVCIATDAMTLSDATSAALSGQYAATASDALTLADAASNAAALGVTITEALTLAALVSALNSGTPVLGVRGGFAVQRQLATRRAQIQTARRRN